MMTFDEKPKAVGTSITVTVNSTTMDCSEEDDQTTPSNVTPSFETFSLGSTLME